MPVIAVRAARSVGGRRSAQWHTGSNGAADDALDAMFGEGGCRTVTSLNEMVASVPLYLDGVGAVDARGPAPRVVVVSNSGASCVLAADEAHRLGLPLAALRRGDLRDARCASCRAFRSAAIRST